MKDKLFIKLLLPLLIGSILLWIPLVGDFHIESAILASLAGCFWAAFKACSKQQVLSTDFYAALEIGGYLFLFGVPLLLAALLSGCFSTDGLAFWLLFPLPSVYFGYSIGRLLRIWEVPFRRLLATGVLLLVAVGILIFELFHYPQVYFFNHVWGGWPGPIYDEVIQVEAATVFYRLITVLWALLLWNIPLVGREKHSGWIVLLAVSGIAFSYPYFAEAGINSPRAYLQKVLGGSQQTTHFDLYYDRRIYDKEEINVLAKEHEFYLEEIYQELELSERDTSQKIESYLYAHPWQKKELVGAKYTSFVPVWLNQDQLHIAKPQLDGSLKHELVHVVAKQFGNRIFNASWSIGLIEGLAVALGGGSSSTSTIDQIVVSQKPYPTAEELHQTFSPMGFYGGRAGVNYITAGSFVRYLLENYPVSLLKEAYRTADIPRAYNKPWKELAEGWHNHLDTVDFDSLDEQIADRIFAVPSLFEQECPHVVSAFEEVWDQYRFYQANQDSTDAVTSLDKAVALADSAWPVKAEWSFQHLLIEFPEKVQLHASPQDTSIDLQLLYADAFAMEGHLKESRNYVKNAEALMPPDSNAVASAALETRKDSTQWKIYRQLTYRDILPDSATFEEAHYRTKIRSLRKAIEQQQWRYVSLFAHQLLNDPLDDRYFDDYFKLIHHLAFLQEAELAQQWIKKVSQMPLRLRYWERLQHEVKWLEYVENNDSTNHESAANI